MRRKISLGWIRIRRMVTNSIKRIDHRSPTSLQRRLVKTGSRLVKHARYYWLLLAERHLTRRPFGSMLGWVAALQLPTEWPKFECQTFPFERPQEMEWCLRYQVHERQIRFRR
jgi:hypothetical protein